MRDISSKVPLSNIILVIFVAVCSCGGYRAFPQEPSGSKKHNFIIERYIKEAEHDKRAYLDLASFMKERMMYTESARYLKYYLSTNNDKKVKLLLGEVYYLNGESKKALSILKNLNIRGSEYEIYLYLGLVYEELNNITLAVKYYTKSINFRKNSISLYRLGKIFYNKGGYRKAAIFFKKLIDYDASNRLADYYLGDSYLKQGNFSKAYKYLLKASRFYPENALIANRLSIVKKRLGKSYFLAKKKKLLERRKKIELAAYKPLGGNIPSVRVAVLEKEKSVSFKSSGRIIVEYNGNKSIELKSNTLYTVKMKEEGVALKRYDSDKTIAFLKCPLVLKSSAHPFYVLGAVYGKGSFWQSTLDLSLRGGLEIIRRENYLTVINVLNAEEYLYGVLPAEIYPSSDPEALKAQAVAARTLIFKNLGRHKKDGFDFCSGVHCQVYKGMKEYASINKAVDATRGEVMVYDGGLIEAFYHSNCGGCLRSDAFGKRDYLVNKLDNKNGSMFNPSPWHLERWFKSYPESFCSPVKRRSNFRWQRVYDAEDFLIVYGVPVEELVDIDVFKRGECAHIKSLAVETALKKTVLTGDLKIRRFFDNLKSSAFIVEVKYTKDGKSIVPGLILLWGAGFGHGEGMCQQGAAAMAKDGYNYKEILKHYYNNIGIEKLY